MSFPKPKPLQCYDSRTYTIASDNDDLRCIAATAQKTRCKLNIKKDSLTNVIMLQDSIRNGSDPKLLLQTARELAVARCCKSAHRARLGDDATCLDQVARRYLDHFGKSGLPVTDDEQDDTANHSAGETISKSIVPYSTRPSKTLERTMHEFAGAGKKFGFVYAFTSSLYPGIVKIGYSVEPAVRFAAWAKCMPNLTVLIKRHFAFPTRIERLIHLQLHPQRRKIRMCSCGITHFELFEVANDVAVQVIEQWYELTQKEALYSSDGVLEPAWRNRLAGMTDVSAQKLLDVLGSEQMAKRSMRSTTAVKVETQREVKVKVKVEDIEAESSPSKTKERKPLWAAKSELYVKQGERFEAIDDCDLHTRRLTALHHWSVALQQLSESMLKEHKGTASMERVARPVDRRVQHALAAAA